MDHLQPQSMKIHKKVRNTKSGKRTYVCGGCEKAYKSYPALYLHIKRKHHGIKPPNTRSQKPLTLLPQEKTQANRSQYGLVDIDDIDESVLELEKTEDDFFKILGDTLNLINPLDFKPSLEKLIANIITYLDSTQDEYLMAIKQKLGEFIEEESHGCQFQINNIQFDHETLRDNLPKEEIMILIWFLLWLGKYTVKLEFLPDLCFIFSRIWKVMYQMKAGTQDLCNKMIWTEISKECLKDMTNLSHFKGKDRLLTDFIKKLCIYICKSVE